MPLTPEFKAKTIVALRSGQYEQRRHSIGSFATLQLCCIGVAAHANGLADACVTSEAVNYIGLTPEEKVEWIEWNDQNGFDFDQIANRIEAKY